MRIAKQIGAMLALAAAFGCAGEHCADSQSGVDGCKTVPELSASERAAHCEWFVGTFTSQIFSCDGEMPYTIYSGAGSELYDDCMRIFEFDTGIATCDLPIGYWETCIVNMYEDGCAAYTDYRCQQQHCGWE